MGETAADTLREIEGIRTDLGVELAELEARLPAVARAAKRMATIAAGGGVAGSVALMVVRRARRKARRDRDGDRPVIVVQPASSRMGWLLLGATAIWAGVRVWGWRLEAAESEDRSAAEQPAGEWTPPLPERRVGRLVTH